MFPSSNLLTNVYMSSMACHPKVCSPTPIYQYLPEYNGMKRHTLSPSANHELLSTNSDVPSQCIPLVDFPDHWSRKTLSFLLNNIRLLISVILLIKLTRKNTTQITTPLTTNYPTEKCKKYSRELIMWQSLGFKVYVVMYT